MLLQNFLATNSNIRYKYIESTSKWEYDPNYPVTDDSFVETSYAECISQLTATRKEDHSLPDITFLKLKETSPPQGAGMQVPAGDNSGIVLTFEGSAPDIGYMNYAPIIEPPTSNLWRQIRYV